MNPLRKLFGAGEPDGGRFFEELPGNLFGAVTSAVVALPMALAFGVASGLGPVAGIYGAVAVGFFAAVFGGTPSQISGPTGPMTVAMATVVTLHADSLATAFSIVMLAGLLQISFGALRIGSLVSYTPYSVISGFMSGIGIIIVLQVLPFLGADSVAGGPLSQIAAWPDGAGKLNPDSAAVGAIALAICIFWPARFRKFFPPALAALVIGTAAALLHFNGAIAIGKIPAALPALQPPQLQWHVFTRMIEPALVIALLGSIDSLLTSLVADSLTRTRHNPNRELIGQGLGNLAAGLVGGLPGAGATMGTVTSIRAGGRSPVAGALGAIIRGRFQRCCARSWSSGKSRKSTSRTPWMMRSAFPRASWKSAEPRRNPTLLTLGKMIAQVSALSVQDRWILRPRNRPMSASARQPNRPSPVNPAPSKTEAGR